MKLLKNCLATLLVLMIAVITFFTWNLIISFVSNYQAFSPTSLSSIPMVIFMIEIFVILYALFDYICVGRRDAFLFRKYSLIVGCLAIVGIAFSIVNGTYVYHTFIGDYVFSAYPLFMLIIHTLFLGISIYVAIIAFKQILQEKPEKTWKNPRFYGLRRVLIAFMLMFAFEKLGAVVLLPLLWSSYDSVYVIPFYFQLLVPMFLFVAYMVDRYWLHNKKVNIILLSIGFGYSLLSFIYMVCLPKMLGGNYGPIVEPLAPIMQLERLIKSPYGFMILYALCFLFSGINLVLNIIRLLKEKKVEA